MSGTLDNVLQDILHPDTAIRDFERWLLYKVADRVGLLPEGFVLPEDPNLGNVVASNEMRAQETPEQRLATDTAAFQAAVAKASEQVIAERMAGLEADLRAAIADTTGAASKPAPEPAPTFATELAPSEPAPAAAPDQGGNA